MATTYRLYFYTRALQDGDAVSSSDWGILRHGAYYLVKETEENGEKSYEATLIDLDSSNDQITFHITPTQDVKLYTFADGEEHYFMTSMRDGQDVTEDFLEGHDARCNQIMSGEAAKNAFEKIRLDAELREVLYQGHQGINYGIILRNCIGWSTYMSNMFLGGTDYTLDPVTAKRVEKILKEATHLYSSPTLQKILNRLGIAGIALGLTTVASMAKAAVEDDDMDGAIEIVSDFFVSEFSGAAGGALSVSAAIKVLTCLSVTNPVIFGGTVFLSGILGAIAASEIGGAIFNEHKDRIISAVRDLFGWESTYDGEQNLRQVLKRQNIMAETTRSPLILDLDGNGVETVSVNDGVYFDHDGNGFAEKSGWVSKDDAILVRDLNNNGQIDDGSELFGDWEG